MYAIFDIALDCDIPLPELKEVAAADSVITVRCGVKAKDLPTNPEWFHHWRDEEQQVNISCAEYRDNFFLRFPDTIDFIISNDASTVEYYANPGITADTIRHLLLDQVIPRMLGQQGKLILHASAITLPNGQSLAFIGESGDGKSTLAASFFQDGADLLSDDCLHVSEEQNRIIGIPNYYGVRLFEDSQKAIFKQNFSTSAVSQNSQKRRLILPKQSKKNQEAKSVISHLFFLSEGIENSNNDDVILRPVKGADELISLLKQTFILDVRDMDLIQNQFQSIHRIFSCQANMYRLQYNKKFSSLARVRSAIEALL